MMGTEPLRGKRVLVTRARAQADEMVRRLRALGAEPLLFPTIEIRPPADGYAALDAALGRLADFDWVVFTSVNGVEHVLRRLEHLGLEPSALNRAQVAAIGPATANALRARGVRVSLLPREYVAEALLEAFPAPAGRRFLLLRADIARPALREGLRAAGADVEEVAVYRTALARPEPSALARLDGGVNVLTFTASSAVRNFVAIVGDERARRLAAQAVVAVIGPVTAQTARELGLRVDVVAGEHTVPGLIEALCAHLAARSRV